MLDILGYGWPQLISVYNSERIIKIGKYLPKLCSNEKGSGFLTRRQTEDNRRRTTDVRHMRSLPHDGRNAIT